MEGTNRITKLKHNSVSSFSLFPHQILQGHPSHIIRIQEYFKMKYKKRIDHHFLYKNWRNKVVKK